MAEVVTNGARYVPALAEPTQDEVDKAKREVIKAELFRAQNELSGINEELKVRTMRRTALISRCMYLQAQLTVLKTRIGESSPPAHTEGQS